MKFNKLIKNEQYLDNIRDDVDKLLKRITSDYSIIKRTVEMNLYKGCDGKVKFEVNVINVDPKSKPFIMTVAPDLEELQKRAKPLVEKLNNDVDSFFDLWTTIPKWHIEIDSRLFQKDHPLRLDNGSQFVALICHELGHIVIQHPSTLVYRYQCNMAKFSIYQKMFLKEGSSIFKLFIPFFLCADGLRIIVNKPINDVNEIMADLAGPDQYKYYLLQYIEHHILFYGYSGIILTTADNDNDYDKGIEFTKETIFLMKKRRFALKTYLNTQYLLNPSPYYKTAYALVSKSVSGDNPETGKHNSGKDKYITECFNLDDATISKKVAILIENSRISERDIMILSTRADDIQTPEDKVYIINTLYDYIEILEKQRNKELAKCKDASKVPKDVIYEPKLKMLYEIRDRVMDKKVYTNGDRYGLFIKYPDGYEG